MPTRPLGDDDLADEIELYGAVVVAASAKEGELSPQEIDDALGVPGARPEARAPARQRRDEGAGGASRVP
ncbi:hypothetical protein WDZ17_15335 [Pseudokineococcus basanitobsidens]|uniref:Uncharacterized protein n=1 Tax=Pseudokineococcus basanitobsidens TaxID=1926649 RepID=A0ABU8RNQ7_9ACTN